jgi:uncharacterized protein (TIGR02145 family)
MKKSLLSIALLLSGFSFVYGQAVSINTDGSAPNASSILDVKSTTSGVLLPRMTTTQRDAIANPATGLIIYNTTLSCLQINTGLPATPAWNCLGPSGSSTQPVVGSLVCGSAVFTPASFTGDLTYAGLLSVPYTGGNGAAYGGGSAVLSTGVTGLTAVLLSGTLNNGAGSINYLVAGTPVSGGIATFPISFGGQTCFVSFNGTNSIPGNSSCDNETISGTGCGSVAGAVLNDDPATPDGIEYNWPGASGYMYTSTRALVEIGGQCWFRYNAISGTDNINNWPAGINTTFGTPIQWGNGFAGMSGSPEDLGYHGFYNVTIPDGTESWQATEPANGEGRLYQWSAAMKGSTANRAQGVCPAGWHIPSDCEWMYLESILGMGTAEQQIVGFRTEGNVDSKLLAGGSSGFNALLGGYRFAQFSQRGDFTQWWSSTTLPTPPTNVEIRSLSTGAPGVYRNASGPAAAGVVRCLKD